MKIKLTLLASILLLSHFSQAQIFKPLIKKGEPVVDYVPDFEKLDRSVTAEQQDELFKIWQDKKSLTGFSNNQTSAGTVFEMIYDPAVPEKVKEVFNEASRIWSEKIQSDVPIRVQVYWKPLGTNILGSANANDYRSNFPGAPRVNTFYPIAIAEKITHQNLNGDDPDIIANFSSSYGSWYFGTTGLPKLPTNPGKTNGEIDLLSVVLHEFGHGLGFIGSINANTNNTAAGYSFPSPFDHLIQDNDGLNITDTTTKYKNFSAELFKIITTPGGLKWSSPKILANNSNRPAILYSPRTYDQGSSIYHVNSGSYPVGNPDALMVPFIAQGEITREIGPITLNGFNDMGWYGSSIVAYQERDFEDGSKDFKSKARIYSDTLLAENSLRFYYALDNQSILFPNEVIPVLGNDGTYTATIPAVGQEHRIKYYWQMWERSEKMISTPAEAPVLRNSNALNYYTTFIGKDIIKPLSAHLNSLKYIYSNQTEIKLPSVFATDNIGIKEVVAEYRINDGPTKTVIAERQTDTLEYIPKISFSAGELVHGDVIHYRILVKDLAQETNVLTLPESSDFAIQVVGLLPEKYYYHTNFDTLNVADDFYLKGFSISKPQYFSDLALNSDHPYADGLEEYVPNSSYQDLFTNNDAILRHPIVLLSDTSKMYFDQIALVEPGASGASFYNSDGSINREFYDYVIVQASNDFGKTWYDLREGWDANFDSGWLTSYNSKFDANGNSTGVATPARISSMTITINEKKHFKPGDQLIFRFRLHADVGAYGWGWYVDNLRIQTPKNQKFNELILGKQEKPNADWVLYPNPAKNKLNLILNAQQASEVNFHLYDSQGATILQKNIEVNPGINLKSLDISNLKPGMYFLQGNLNGQVQTFKMIKEN